MVWSTFGGGGYLLYYCELRPWRALYECYYIVVLLYTYEAICKVLYEAICKVLCEAICEGMMWMSFMWSCDDPM